MIQMMAHTLTARLTAELIGTCVLVVVGPGAAMVFRDAGALGHVATSLAFGGAVAGVCALIGPISGGHINPAMTLARRWRGEISSEHAAMYVLAQLVGASAAGVMLLMAMPGRMDAAQTMLAPGVGVWSGVVCEMMLTLVMVVTGLLVKGKWGPVAVGVVVFVDALVGGPMTGASMNPARTFGPAVAFGGGIELWVYVAGPLLGASLAVPLAKWWERRLKAQIEPLV
jgi:aquaporin Z